MTSHEQDQLFIAAVTNSRMLEEALDWIANNMSPEDVFEPGDLGDWAKANGYVEEEEG